MINEATVGAEAEALLGDLWGSARGLWEKALVVAALAKGERDTSALTDLVFSRRHPERGGRALSPREPGFDDLAREWNAIRDTLVQPALQAAAAAQARSASAGATRPGSLPIPSGPVHRPPSQIGDWTDLIRFRIPADLEAELARPDNSGVSYSIQTIGSAQSDDINLDYYPVYVSRMPIVGGARVTAEELLGTVRREINRVLDNRLAKFSPASPTHASRWASEDPQGAVLFIDIWGPDDAYVVCSEAQTHRWRFSTLTQHRREAGKYAVHTINDEHPVSGTREFGVVGFGQHAVFYTKGADRGSWRLEAANRKAFSEGHKLWQSFQRLLVGFVTSHGGQAQRFMVGERGEPFVSVRRDWPSVNRRL